MRARTLVILLLVAGAGYWIYKTQATVAGFVDGLVSPLMRSKAVVKESEYKRIVAEAVPAPEGQETPPAALALKEGMKKDEVKEALGPPDRVEWIVEDGKERLRWTYLRAGRVIVFDDRGRVASIAIR